MNAATAYGSGHIYGPGPAYTPPPLLVRIIDVLLVMIAIIDFYQSLVIYPVVIIPALSPLKPAIFFFNAVVTFGTVLGGAVFFVRWQRRVNKGVGDEGRRHAWCLGIIRYWIAVEIFNYAFAKVLGTQFAPSYFRADSTWGSLSGFDLTWNYFGYSTVFADLIAVLQITGCGMLLFRQTTIAGALLLLPVMANIVFIDYFYHIATGALVNASLFTLGLIYLLVLERAAIVAFFRQTVSRLPAIKLGGWKNLLRLGIVLYGFGFIYFVTTTKRPATLVGKWKVERLTVNGEIMGDMDWLKNDRAWKHIYLEDYGRATFSPNPYVVEPGRSMLGLYTIDKGTGALHFSLHADSGGKDVDYTALVTRSDGRTMEWTMTNRQDTIVLGLTKVDLAKR